MLCLLSTEQLHKADFTLPTVVVFVVVVVVFTLSRPLSMRITSHSSTAAAAVVVVGVIEVCLNGVNQTFSSV